MTMGTSHVRMCALLSPTQTLIFLAQYLKQLKFHFPPLVVKDSLAALVVMIMLVTPAVIKT